LALVGVSLAAPQTPQVYKFDYFNHEENRAQFLRRNGDSYSWGYEFPERVHLENSDGPGQVEGSYGYVDANGVPVLVAYKSDPENGFTADIQQLQSAQSFPASRSESVPVVKVQPYNVPVAEEKPYSIPVAEASLYNALVQELPVVGNLAAPAPLLQMVPMQPLLTPLLKAAVQTGKITQFEILEDGSSTFAVSPQAFHEAGSISNLAVQLGASLPAAVHDVQSPFISNEQPGPSLDYKDNLFVVRVPSADPDFIVEI